MESFAKLIGIRRSMRKFTEEELTQDEVVALLRSALIAPSSKGSHAWEFVVVDDKDLLRQLAHCKDRGAELIEGAPLAVAVLAQVAGVIVHYAVHDEEEEWRGDWNENDGRDMPTGLAGEDTAIHG